MRGEVPVPAHVPAHSVTVGDFTLVTRALESVVEVEEPLLSLTLALDCVCTTGGSAILAGVLCRALGLLTFGALSLSLLVVALPLASTELRVLLVGSVWQPNLARSCVSAR